MATLVAQNVSSGAAFTTQAAAGGGDACPAGTNVGGWSSGCYLFATIGATSTTITVGGTAHGPFSNATLMLPVHHLQRGKLINVTYNQVTNVNVAAVEISPKV